MTAGLLQMIAGLRLRRLRAAREQAAPTQSPLA
jgi:hypothetical protein